MTKIYPLAYLFLIFTFTSCQFNQSINKDLVTGAYSRGNGIGCDDVTIEVSGIAQQRNKFVYGEKVDLVFENIKGLKRIDGKTYPGMSMLLIKNEQDTLESNLNLLSSMVDGTENYPVQLRAYFRANLPYKNDEEYKVLINIWDKKGDGNFFYELPFEIVSNDLLKVKNSGFSYSDIYLWNKTLKQPVYESKVSSKHDFLLIIEGLTGFQTKEDNVFPIYSVELSDNDKNLIMSNPNILMEFDSTGLSPKKVKEQLISSINFSSDVKNNPYQLFATIKDKNSSNTLYISAELHIN